MYTGLGILYHMNYFFSKQKPLIEIIPVMKVQNHLWKRYRNSLKKVHIINILQFF